MVVVSGVVVVVVEMVDVGVEEESGALVDVDVSATVVPGSVAVVVSSGEHAATSAAIVSNRSIRRDFITPRLPDRAPHPNIEWRTTVSGRP